MAPIPSSLRVLMDFAFVEDVPIFCYVFRRAGDDFLLVHLNAAARTRSPALMAFIGRPLAALYSDQPEIQAATWECVNDQKVVDLDVPFRMHNRTEATEWIRLRYVPMQPDLVLIYVTQLNRPEMSQTALRESEARYEGLVASLPDAVLLRGGDGRVLFCNDVAVELFGAASRADILGKLEVLGPEVRAYDEAGCPIDPDDVPSMRVLKTGKPERPQMFSFESGGNVRWMRVAAQPIHSAGGRVTGSVATFTDITERVVAQEELRKSTARLELALASACMGVWEYEPAVDRGWWSPNLSDIFRIDNGMGLGRFLEHVHAEDRAEAKDQLAAIAAGEHGQSVEHEYRIVGDDGVARWARTFGRLTVTDSRRVLVGTIMDITEQRRLEEQLHLASRLESIGRLAGGVAHDFNNLLAAMLGSLDLIDEHVSDDVRKDLGTIRHSALRARDLTRQLLAFARKQPVSVHTVDLGALVHDVQRLLHRLVGPRIAIEIVTQAQPLVSADPSLLEQVLVNLVVNARDAMPEGGRLEIRIETAAAEPDSAPHGTARITVTDSGVGMDEATRARIFEPFFTTKAHGTGLGLASSYGIIQQHGGDITVESEPSRGTRFIVSLPCVAPGQGVHKRAPSSSRPPPARGTVLVVDDEDAVRRTILRLVQALGYSALEARSGVDAKARVAAHDGRIDILLCDIAMPGEDGRDLAAELVKTRPGLSVVFMSGYSTDMQALRVEGALFLQKPFGREELGERLGEAAGVTGP
jgi:two-component system, cell cycle sensor histidine kinase and response regulator CckA